MRAPLAAESTAPYVELQPDERRGLTTTALVRACAALITAFLLWHTVNQLWDGAVEGAYTADRALINAYTADAVDWSALRGELEAFVPSCACGPILVRLSWHDAGTFNSTDGTGGSHAEQRFSQGEATDPANAGLSVARALLQPFKERYPAVGYADLWALAAVVAVPALGGPRIPFRAGRRDGTPRQAVEHGRLPDGALGASHLRSVFGRMGFDDEDIVALSGAHTLGRCHADRSGFDGPWTHDPLRFDTEYFRLLLSCGWEPSSVPSTGKPQEACAAEPGLMMLRTDVALVTDAALRPHVERFAKEEGAFFAAFAKAFQRLQELGHTNLHEVSG